MYEKKGQYLEAGEYYEKAGDAEKAAEAFEKGGNLNKSNELLSKICYEKGFLREAAVFAEKAGDSARAAEIYTEVQEFSKAGEQYIKAGYFNEAGEKFIQAQDFQRVAEAFEKGGKYVWAAQAYEKIGDITVKTAELYEKGEEFFKAGKLYEELGLQDRALNALQKIDESSENYEAASIVIGGIFKNKGMMNLAIERFQKIIDNRPISKSTLEPYYYLALCYEKTGEREMAKSIYDKILAVDYQFRDVDKRSNEITIVSSGKSISGQVVHESVSREGRIIPFEDSQKKRYELLQEIGRGGMGIVYKAKDTLLNRIIAYKVLPSFLNADPSNLNRFLKEARISANLNHRNIITIFDAGCDGQNNFITMEYVEGKTIDTYLKDGRKFKFPDVVNIAKQICRALAYAHKNNVVHRDIKPANIMISMEGVIKIMDFGIAKLLEDISKETTSISGTPLYMSPEQIIGKDVNFQTDLYSLGVTLYELATGRPPFTEGDIYYHHLHSVPVPPKELYPLIPEGLCKVILKCLEKEKAARYKEAEDILVDLDKVQ